jgi:hypothetical protein
MIKAWDLSVLDVLVRTYLERLQCTARILHILYFEMEFCPTRTLSPVVGYKYFLTTHLTFMCRYMPEIAI